MVYIDFRYDFGWGSVHHSMRYGRYTRYAQGGYFNKGFIRTS